MIISDLLTALGFLTVVPVGQKKVPPERMAGAMALFPVAGLMVGSVFVLFDFLFKSILPRQVVDALIIAMLAVITGGLHLDALADTADGIMGGKGDKEKTLAIMKDSRTGAMGVSAIAILLLVKFVALDSVSTVSRPAALILAPALSRWGQVLMSYGSRPARSDGGLGSSFITHIKPEHFITASALAIVFAAVFGRWYGLAALVAVAAVCLLLKISFNRCIGGETGDTIGAASEVSEALVFIVFSAMI